MVKPSIELLSTTKIKKLNSCRMSYTKKNIKELSSDCVNEMCEENI